MLGAFFVFADSPANVSVALQYCSARLIPVDWRTLVLALLHTQRRQYYHAFHSSVVLQL